MSGLRLQKELAALAARYGFEPRPSRVALSEPVDYPMTLSGIASTSDIDHERVSFAPRCFGLLRTATPLLYDHDDGEPAGRIDELKYDIDGRLLVRATVTHPEARRCGAFSVAAHIDEYEIRNADTRHFYAVVTKARLGDVSLVACPVNSHALVTHRFKSLPLVPPSDQFFDLMIQRVQLVEKMLKIVGEQQCRA